MMVCPVCHGELDQELEVPIGILWGNLLASELTCANCGSKTGLIQEVAPPQPASPQPVPDGG
jgi:C4-type Zn-finger protein